MTQNEAGKGKKMENIEEGESLRLPLDIWIINGVGCGNLLSLQLILMYTTVYKTSINMKRDKRNTFLL